MMAPQRLARPETFSDQQQQLRQQQQSQQQSPTQLQPTRQQSTGNALTEDRQEAAGTTSQIAEQVPLAQMSEQNKYGLPGLLRMIHSESPDITSLTIGQDLMSLGLDLNQPEYARPKDIPREEPRWR